MRGGDVTFDDVKKFLALATGDVEKLEVVMDLGRMLDVVPDGAVCTEIVGCSSFVQICRDGNRFFARADSALVRGVVAIIISMVDGKSPDEIKKMDIQSEFDALGLNLGAGRLNGVNSMIRFLKNL